ncbi:MAG: Serine-type D-Ala-D-Ala carboxypeptidase [Candidatus Woesebacteria bacterium GW2011_GWD1_31_12]|nr:MAG: Serine-type D-Ala-D-Ala carboxypeptidase [Candidatus Woesebacteria bacterium GW2011_GWD1_31_12]
MSIGAIILMTVFFPLNSLLFLQEGFASEKLVQADEQVAEKSIDSLAEVVPQVQKQEIIKAQAVDVPEYQPIRKNGVRDLVVPGAHASVIIDADSGTIMHYNDGRSQRQIASLTKIMTAVLVMEKVKDLDEIVTIDEEAIYAEGTKIGASSSVI